MLIRCLSGVRFFLVARDGTMRKRLLGAPKILVRSALPLWLIGGASEKKIVVC